MSVKSQPIRTCTGCGERKVKTEMVRLVADPSGLLIPDLKGSLPSRGAYICPDAGCIAKAVDGKLAISLKVTGDDLKNTGDLRNAIAAAYSQRVLSLLGQARKSGRVTSGTSLVEGELRRQGQGTWLGLIALDASSSIAEKIEKALNKASVPYRTLLSREKLGGAVGKSPRSVVLVRDENMARAIKEAVDRCQSILSNGGLDQ